MIKVRKSKALFIVTVVFVFLISLVAAAEIGLRAVLEPSLYEVFAPVDDPRLIFNVVPGSSAAFRGINMSLPASKITIDEDGSRLIAPYDEGCADIWILGDSIAFGYGVSDFQTYAYLLAEELRPGLGCRPKVSNFAVPGYHLGQSLARLRIELGRARPDLIVLHIVGNDGNPDFNYASPLGWPRGLIRRSRIALLANVLAISRFDAENRDPAAGPARISRLLSRIDAWADLIDSQGLKMVVVIEPDLPGEVVARLESRFSNVLKLNSCSGGADRFAAYNHLTPQGHMCAARSIAPYIIKALSRDQVVKDR